MSFARIAALACALASPFVPFCNVASADMGRIVLSGSDAKVEETSQKALILHDRREEVLILGTEIASSAAQPIIRFIPFPSEPKVSLAPVDTFDRVGAMLAKYRLRFATRWMTKGGASSREQSVEIVSAERLGSHDVTVLQVRDVAAFRGWINDYFRSRGLPTAVTYPREEAIVADYVARGLDHFVLDRVDLGAATRFVEPLAFRFESADLYYPLLTSNSFGGAGAIELFVVAPVTLCRPGSNDPSGAFRGEDVDASAAPTGGRCLDLDAKASTSARLPPEEDDLTPIFPDWRAFFGDAPIFLQAIRRIGPYRFTADVRAPLVGEAKALEPERPVDRPYPGLGDLAPPAACAVKPERGPCKAAFEAWAFDPATAACKPFLWGGCGDPPPFSTREDCERTCRPH
ncbi:MAG: DUF2330 domain-containing protein [Hyphomicrobiales bacterium]|nr:DUF2330 domain-containing protein [Hyphomicrobiales bacterium]